MHEKSVDLLQNCIATTSKVQFHQIDGNGAQNDDAFVDQNALSYEFWDTSVFPNSTQEETERGFLQLAIVMPNKAKERKSSSHVKTSAALEEK